ncbi:hypothetical protein FNF27_05020 [Cafeteria roenbergensis]|uniref:Eukaryotic peptide chain release factor subunit 1 n=1 Tax=Cafeteria roenbergensis TaxID=33653 RepID=A0A5A8E6W2_CAFRO|nr:hypothetical protein FNF28_07079 [Cafeteria roenbergensis]KAA0157293.1 hypothetical protein FNF29_00645 [Cafeteria roenbergensis]KAA0161956.1 hypothetical protein FNF31_03533 [Cafeteria roenbergensis]KAA0173525.1 hypothetical protein FNF27_05020 [Cafeteria roenbergensis]|eukprot:KAA0157293.1 hypothetical protein FNF29_00645 [Cafeteria roenbergensis]
MAAGAGAAAAAAAAGDETTAIEIFKIKKLVNSLDRARGNGTSMISLVLPPKSQIAQAAKMLADEYGTASNIKSRVNRLSVLSAITSTQQRLKNWTKCPDNGLVIFVGEILTDDGKEKKLAIDFEPFKPINTSLYLCDNRFHTEALSELLTDDDAFGFIVMDGSGSLYGRVSGSSREILHRFTVDLPKKHGRGGQSALRFARLRLEKRHNYVRKVAENAVAQFITADRPNVKGIVLAGSAEFKNDLQKSDLLDPRLKSIVIKVVDVSYGGENGFNQAIELSSECLSNVKLIEEKRLIGSFFDEIARDTGMFCFGIKDTMMALEMSACEKVILWEDLPLVRYELRNPSTGEASVMFLNPEEAEDRTKFRDPATGVDLEISDHTPFVEWMAENFKSFGARVEFITDRSAEGAQFVRGFGGIGGLMRWKVDFVEMDEFMDDDEDFI